MASREIVFDIETQNTFRDVGGYDHKLLKVSVVGAYFYETNEYKSFFEEDLPVLWSKFESADRIIGYNIKGFDIPVLNNYYAGDLFRLPMLDIMEKVEKSLGFRIKLDSIAGSTLGYGKSANGLMAVEYWKQGNLEDLKKYCLQDVKITKEIYEYGLKYGAIAYSDHIGGRKGIKVDFKPDKKDARGGINLTMPV